MIAQVIDPPAPIVSWEEAKQHLRVDDDERAYVESLVQAAQAWFDGPSGWLGHSFGLQTIDLVSNSFTDVPLPYQPVAEVISVTYRDPHGTQLVMAPADYRLLYSGAVYSNSWPSLHSEPEAVVIRVRAGYAPREVPPEDEDADPTYVSTVPASAKEALLLIIGHWYANRESVVTGTIATEVPGSARSLLDPFRSWRS